MRFVCSRTAIANSIFSLILEAPDFVAIRCGSLIKADVTYSGIFRSGGSCPSGFSLYCRTTSRLFSTYTRAFGISQSSQLARTQRYRSHAWYLLRCNIVADYVPGYTIKSRFRVEIELKFFAVQKESWKHIRVEGHNLFEIYSTVGTSNKITPE